MNFRHSTGEPVRLAIDPRAESFAVGEDRVPLVSRDDLIAMKERAAADPQQRKSKRLQDQADVERLRGDVPDPDEGWQPRLETPLAPIGASGPAAIRS